MAGKTHSSLLRRLYLENQLVKGELKIRHTRIDLAKVKSPVLLVSAMDDHIAPWQGTWQGMKLFGGEQRFILAESGHIAGIINPPGGKGHFLTAPEGKRAPTAAAWKQAATRHDGSWWTDWTAWLGKRSGKMVKPPGMGSEGFPPLMDAPGRYVLEK